MLPRIDIRRCKAARKYEGDLSFTFEGKQEWIDIPFVAFSSPVTAELHYSLSEEDEVEICGKFSFSLKGACSRCLKETERLIEGETEALFLPEEGDGDYVYRNGIVEPDDFLRDAVLVLLPMRLLCSEECVMPEYGEENTGKR